MTRVAVVTDSVASIPQDLIEELNIHLVPYYIQRGTETLRDLVTAKTEDFYEWMKSATEIPKTANPSPGEYLEQYIQLAEEGVGDIISIHITSRGSGAYGAAMAAKRMFHEKFPKVRLVWSGIQALQGTAGVILPEGFFAPAVGLLVEHQVLGAGPIAVSPLAGGSQAVFGAGDAQLDSFLQHELVAAGEAAAQRAVQVEDHGGDRLSIEFDFSHWSILIKNNYGGDL